MTDLTKVQLLPRMLAWVTLDTYFATDLMLSYPAGGCKRKNRKSHEGSAETRHCPPSRKENAYNVLQQW